MKSTQTRASVFEKKVKQVKNQTSQLKLKEMLEDFLVSCSNFNIELPTLELTVFSSATFSNKSNGLNQTTL